MNEISPERQDYVTDNVRSLIMVVNASFYRPMPFCIQPTIFVRRHAGHQTVHVIPRTTSYRV